MKVKLLLLLLLSSTLVFAQGEASNWFFGSAAGIKFNNDGSITTLSVNPNPIQIQTNEGCSAYSDVSGNLMLYTDGRTVWDRNHLAMPNGDYNNLTGLFGDPSSTQSAIIIPKPGNPNIYYIFTVDEPHHDNRDTYPNQNFDISFEEDDGFNNGFNYSIVDMSIVGENGSIGDITVRNTHLVTYDPNPVGEQIKYKCSEKITAVKAADNSGYWVITHFVDKFYVFKIDANGVNSVPVVTEIVPNVPVSGYRRNAIGQLKASPDGKKIAIAHQQLGTSKGGTTGNGVVYLYDFDNQTGQISNAVLVRNNVSPYGIEFSASAKRLYVGYDSSTVQYNLESETISASGVTVSNSTPGSLQLGPNQKIYVARLQTTFLDVINNPDDLGAACNYGNAAINLDQGMCYFGLPPFITSFFFSSLSASNFCLGDNTNFYVNSLQEFDSISWDFGDGSAVSTVENPSHSYTEAGTFTATATIVYNGEVNINTIQITIVANPTATDATLQQCALGDGTAVLFDLTNAIPQIIGDQTGMVVNFYATLQDAENQTNVLPTIFSTTLDMTQVFAVATNSASCRSIATVILGITNSQEEEVSLTSCSGNIEGFATFDLSSLNLGGAAQNTITYYSSAANIYLAENPISINFTNTVINSQVIYAVVNSAGQGCDAIYPIKLIATKNPKLKDQPIKYICTDNPSATVALKAELETNQSGITYLWSSGEITSTIVVSTAGLYSVTVTNANGCVATKQYEVKAATKAQIQNVIVDGLGSGSIVTVVASLDANGGYLYSIDSENGPYQTSNVFTNLTSGAHIVYIKSPYACGIASKIFTILEFPKFFTPNGDGINDTWSIVGIDKKFNTSSEIYIFDRYGKLLTKIDPKSFGWNGIYNGHALPATDYWFTTTLPDGTVYKGHFSLVR